MYYSAKFASNNTVSCPVCMLNSHSLHSLKAGSQYDAMSCVVLHCVAQSYCEHAAVPYARYAMQRKDRPKTYPCVCACVVMQCKMQDLTSL